MGHKGVVQKVRGLPRQQGKKNLAEMQGFMCGSFHRVDRGSGKTTISMKNATRGSES